MRYTVGNILLSASLRLCHRYRRLAAAGKPKVVVTNRDRPADRGLIWALARMVQPRPAIG